MTHENFKHENDLHLEQGETGNNPEATVSSLVNAAKSGEPAAIFAANKKYIDTIYDEAARNSDWSTVYTEVHKVGEAYIFTPSVRNQLAHYAQVDGYHSMFDGGTHEAFNAASQMESNLGQGLGLTTESVVAKGMLARQSTGAYYLKLGDVRSADGTMDWLDGFTRQAVEYENQMRIVLKKTDAYRRSVEQNINEPIPLRTGGTIYPKTLRLQQEHAGIASGFVTSVEEVEPPHVKKAAGGTYYRFGAISFNAVEALSPLHQTVYDAAGYGRPHMVPITVGDKQVEIAIDYTIDESNKRSNALIMLSGDVDEDIQTMVRATVRDFMPDTFDSKINVHVEKPRG